jgi:hypothetical protein
MGTLDRKILVAAYSQLRYQEHIRYQVDSGLESGAYHHGYACLLQSQQLINVPDKLLREIVH